MHIMHAVCLAPATTPSLDVHSPHFLASIKNMLFMCMPFYVYTNLKEETVYRLVRKLSNLMRKGQQNGTSVVMSSLFFLKKMEVDG